MKEINVMRNDMITQSIDKESFKNIDNSVQKFTRLFRNNTAVGVAYDFNKKKLILPIRIIRAGLTKGSSDLIGWESVIVTQEMVGKRVAIFKAVESKSEKGKLRKEQEKFLNIVKKFGGIVEVNKPEKE